jgi:dihydropyrimidinase
LTWEDLRRFHPPHCFENSKMICSPPPGLDASDQDALWTGLHNGTFTIFSSDHCPFIYNDRKGKMLGILDHQTSMEGKGVPTDDELEEFALHKKGHFAYIPNVGRRPFRGDGSHLGFCRAARGSRRGCRC